MTRAARKAATRAHLRATARDLFDRDGFDATSIGAITRAAGVAHGTFYVHFASKEVLLDELLAEFNEDLAARIAPIWQAPDRAVADRVTQTAEVFLDTWAARRGFVEIVAARLATGVRLEQLRDGVNPPAVALLATVIVQLGTAGYRVPEPDLVAQGLLAAWLRIGLQHLFGDVARERAVAALVHLSLGALGAPESQ